MFYRAVASAVFAWHKDHDGVNGLSDGKRIMSGTAWHSLISIAQILAASFHDIQHSPA